MNVLRNVGKLWKFKDECPRLFWALAVSAWSRAGQQGHCVWCGVFTGDKHQSASVDDP